jgi:hypothetical protein
VPDGLAASDIPEKSAGEQSVSAALLAFLDNQHAGALVMRGDSRAGASWTAPYDEDVNINCGIHGYLAPPR